MIKWLRGLLVGLGLGFALFYSSGQASEVYQGALALMVLAGVLIPLEQQDRRMDRLFHVMKEVDVRMKGLEERVDILKTLIEERLEEVEEEDEDDDPVPRFEVHEDPRYLPAVQPGIHAGRPVMAQGHRTVERSVEDVARKLASMQRGDG
ncbi:MAG: hypothetical protein HQM02_10865 [Magnetococcales bacterium]|nr:hypothetical protein [Magnetococcales bacterium]